MQVGEAQRMICTFGDRYNIVQPKNKRIKNMLITPVT